MFLQTANKLKLYIWIFSFMLWQKQRSWFGLKYPVLSAQNSAEKCPDVMSKLCHNHGWKIPRRLVINTQFCCHKDNWECPQISLKISGFISIKHDYKMSWLFVKDIQFCHHTGKCLNCSLKKPGFNSTNTAGKCPKLLNTKFSHHKHGWNMSSHLGKNIRFWCYKHFRKHPKFLLKMFSFLLQAQPFPVSLTRCPVQ